MVRSEATTPHGWTVTTMAAIKARLAADQQARRALGGPNEPSDPTVLVAPYKVELPVDLDDMNDDLRRIKAEYWCLGNTERRWFRRIDRRRSVVSFVFECHLDATMFRLSH